MQRDRVRPGIRYRRRLRRVPPGSGECPGQRRDLSRQDRDHVESRPRGDPLPGVSGPVRGRDLRHLPWREHDRPV